MSTIGEHFAEITTSGKERTLELLSDGEIQLRSIKDYQHWEALLQSCRETIAAKSGVVFSGRRGACADLLDSAMQRLRRDHHGARAPKCWLRVIHKLRDEDGPVTVLPKTPEAPAEPEPPCPYGDYLRSMFLCLGLFHGFSEGLPTPLIAEVLTEHRQRMPEPMGWTDAAIFLEVLLEDLRTASEIRAGIEPYLTAIRARVSELEPRLRAEQERDYRARICARPEHKCA